MMNRRPYTCGGHRGQRVYILLLSVMKNEELLDYTLEKKVNYGRTDCAFLFLLVLLSLLALAKKCQQHFSASSDGYNDPAELLYSMFVDLII